MIGSGMPISQSSPPLNIMPSPVAFVVRTTDEGSWRWVPLDAQARDSAGWAFETLLRRTRSWTAVERAESCSRPSRCGERHVRSKQALPQELPYKLSRRPARGHSAAQHCRCRTLRLKSLAIGPARQLQDSPSPSSTHRRRRRRQRGQGARRPRRGGAARRRPRHVPGALPRRLSARGPRAQARLPGCLPGRLRAPRPGDRRWRPGGAHRPALARGGRLYNAYALLDGGAIAVRFKVDLPNYGVFDEKRVFAPGPLPGPMIFRGVRVGIPICEDIWTGDVVECLAETGAEILLVPNGSPYWRGKTDERFNIAAARVTESGLPLVYLNQVGGQDELVFDGASFVARTPTASLAAQLPAFREDARADGVGEGRRTAGAASRRRWRWSRRATRRITPPACWAFATMSRRTAFPASCSACPAASIRRSARPWRSMRSGPERVHCVMLPYRYTSSEFARGRGGLRRGARRALRHPADRARGRGLRGAAGAALRRARRATSPRRTCRAAPAAPS